jgi:UPF0716 family protein affecting phage T7 exclusion
MFAVIAALIAGGGLVIAMSSSGSFNIGAWYTGVILVLFAVVGRTIVRRDGIVTSGQ